MNKRKTRWRVGPVLLLLAVLVIAGCNGRGGAEATIAANATMHRANPARTGVYDTAGLDKYNRIKWQFEGEDWFFATPAVLGDAVFAASYGGNFYALDRQTGSERWRFETDEPIISSPSADLSARRR